MSSGEINGANWEGEESVITIEVNTVLKAASEMGTKCILKEE